MNTKHFGAFLVIFGFVFGFMETQYFGNNWTPQSTAEYICDTIALVSTFYGWYLVWFGQSKSKA